jgi:hypothetical protein
VTTVRGPVIKRKLSPRGARLVPSAQGSVMDDAAKWQEVARRYTTVNGQELTPAKVNEALDKVADAERRARRAKYDLQQMRLRHTPMPQAVTLG